MFVIEALFVATPEGGFAFVPESDQDESQDWCELHVSFAASVVYPPEPDNGSGVTWDGGIDTIELRPVTGAFRRQRMLTGADFEAAKVFLLREHGAALWQAESDYAEAVHYGEAA